ncbi:hypothetical protein Tco_1081037 [Tanacetum coccineum]|uniref:Uncharacterized protein n=1 Tax=Tanacetum coccineum TaxID=301880 RepID=A0ABQ5HWD7_9ASTR
MQTSPSPLYQPLNSYSEERFGGNDESKKMHKYILKQQFEGFSVSNSEGLHKGYDRLKKFYKKTGRRLQFDAKKPVGFDKTKVESSIAITHGTLLESADQKEIKKAEEEMQGTLDIEQNRMGGDLENRRNLNLTLESVPELVVVEPKVVSQPKFWSDAPIIKEYE